jgi:hypothetical protein
MDHSLSPIRAASSFGSTAHTYSASCSCGENFEAPSRDAIRSLWKAHKDAAD